MNKALQDFARQRLKEMLSKCTTGQQKVFKHMYSFKDLALDINIVVDNMPNEKLDWAMQQCENTIRKFNIKETEK